MKTPQSRITISLPKYVHEHLERLTEKREMSSFVVEAIEEKISKIELRTNESPLDRMFRLADTLPKFSQQELQDAIDKGRP